MAADGTTSRMGDFSRVVVIDLEEELAKGERTVDMDELMASSAEAYQRTKVP